MKDCIFCKIVDGNIPSKKVHENDRFLAFYDIHPKAKIHVLIIPKIHVDTFGHIRDEDKVWLADYFLFVNEVSRRLNIDHFKLQINNGVLSGQEVFHFHTHLLYN